LAGFEKDIPHHFFTEDELREVLAGFDLLKIRKDTSTGNHHSVLALKGC